MVQEGLFPRVFPFSARLRAVSVAGFGRDTGIGGKAARLGSWGVWWAPFNSGSGQRVRAAFQVVKAHGAVGI